MRDVDRQLLRIYLSDHVAGATAGAGRIERMARAYADTPLGPSLADIAAQIAGEREWLIDTAASLGVHLARWKQAGLWVGERVGRLKTNGRVVRTSPLTALLELELMRSAVVGKRSCWQTLLEWSGELGISPQRLDELTVAADQQIAELDRLATIARRRALLDDRTAPLRSAGG
ncbi:hypothetical protein ACGIF2_11045 [Cellulomonas sp. P22]|uniref:hypothetical protein n=1 Tax=Cellulomonas sp. P22 TaxID=3373189 RepID=UPI0037B72306